MRERSIGASYGDAFLAALALGGVGLEDIDRWNPVARAIVPDAGEGEVYEKHLPAFKALYAQNRALKHVALNGIQRDVLRVFADASCYRSI